MTKSIASIVSCIILWSSSAAAQVTVTKLMASDGGTGDWFGASVSLDGEYGIVGAPRNSSQTGAAYVFKLDGLNWTEQAKLTPSDAQILRSFGNSVSISGDYALVGKAEGSVKKAYIFKRDGSTWSETAQFTLEEEPIDVHLFGDFAIVGVTSANRPAGRQPFGAAFVYKRDGESWAEQAELTASDGADLDQLGVSVSMSGDYAIVGAFADDIGAKTDQGSAYIFKRDGESWAQQTKLTASDGGRDDFFGSSVSIDGDYAIVGSQLLFGGAGPAAYIFKRNGANWIEQAKLLFSERAADVHIEGDHAIVGVFSDSDSAYIFMRDGEAWEEQTKVNIGDVGLNFAQQFSVSIAGPYAIVGAPGNDGEKGAAYVIHGFSSPTAVEENVSDFPTEFILEQNYPNPFNPSTIIKYALSSPQHIELTIYNQLGQRIKTLAKMRQPAGAYQIEWDGQDQVGKQVASGVYLYRLKAGSYIRIRKMVLLQ